VAIGSVGGEAAFGVVWRVLSEELGRMEVEGEARAAAAEAVVRETAMQLQVAHHEVSLLQEHLEASTRQADELRAKLEAKEGELHRSNTQLVMHMRQSGSLLAELLHRTEGAIEQQQQQPQRQQQQQQQQHQQQQQQQRAPSATPLPVAHGTSPPTFSTANHSRAAPGASPRKPWSR
jgi:chromosome segregation ATPase